MDPIFKGFFAVRQTNLGGCINEYQEEEGLRMLEEAP